MDAKQLFQAGQLSDAIAAATEDVRQAPTDATKRWFFCELLCFAGDLDRADKQLDAIQGEDARVALNVGRFRHLIRAEQGRREVFSSGRVPELLDAPSDDVRRRLKATVCVRDGEQDNLACLLNDDQSEEPKVTGVADDQAFDEFRDMDDLLAPLLEVLSPNGKYFWVPIANLMSLEFGDPKSPLDLLWRPVRLAVRNGPELDAFTPVLYNGSHEDSDERVRLGRYTDWHEGLAGVVRGVGMRTFLVGSEARTIFDLGVVSFAEAGTVL